VWSIINPWQLVVNLERTIKSQAAYIQKLEKEVAAYRKGGAAPLSGDAGDQTPLEGGQTSTTLSSSSSPSADDLTGRLRLQVLLTEREEEVSTLKSRLADVERECEVRTLFWCRLSCSAFGCMHDDRIAWLMYAGLVTVFGDVVADHLSVRDDPSPSERDPQSAQTMPPKPVQRWTCCAPSTICCKPS